MLAHEWFEGLVRRLGAGEEEVKLGEMGSIFLWIKDVPIFEAFKRCRMPHLGRLASSICFLYAEPGVLKFEMW